MDTKALYVTAVIIAAMSGGYYYYSGKGKKLEVASAQSMINTANGIQVLQTNDQGQLYVTAKVDRLEQDMKLQTSKLDHLDASVYTNNQVTSTFYAKEGFGYNDNEKIVLKGDVKATKFGNLGEMVLVTEQLTGYPKTMKLETQNVVTVNAPNAQFVSQGLQANLNQGQYEFFNIRGKYAPH
ncbi:LPS export ABC transporter periplasmic protein LptC [Acinetobacter shaoyimingii]|uniref:LPS export ABC transporter periplasmic protein LptC n=1 Tax=Acinetobacter shaoyimingii TaxID=2715164 RepID=A0A6G8RVB6_9GAMM|nr:LPS export ABC transporter periplasmic protein LptC [Acinetobacter shaoyimingii]NHB58550.1 LPS export ABC transporter periplasmic protein LptC [Acinetobacter shaoyimingii]QIO05663.1 LPS export ABC transporter periplasmic protein LptC [Acinetobacter shaoyimingii]